MINYNQSLISIITVCYNSSMTIRQTIESVLNQTYKNIEYIIIDGNSTDGTIDIVKEYASQFTAKGIIYRFISEPDKGIYDAMNKGISMVSGDWIGIINSDDWYELDACRLVIDNIQSDTMIAYGICALYDYLNGQYFFSGVMQHSPQSLYLCNSDMAHPAIFIRREIYHKFKFDLSYKLAADLDFLMRIAKAEYTSKFIPYILSNFRCDGATGQQKFLSGKENLEIRFKYGRISRFRFIMRKIILNIKFFLRY